jgi:hypothetical protein
MTASRGFRQRGGGSKRRSGILLSSPRQGTLFSARGQTTIAAHHRIHAHSKQSREAPGISRGPVPFRNAVSAALGPCFVWFLVCGLMLTSAHAEDAGAAERYLGQCELQWMCARFGEAHAECDSAPDVDQCIGNKMEAGDRDEIHKCTNDGRVRFRPHDMPNRWQCFFMNFGKAIH